MSNLSPDLTTWTSPPASPLLFHFHDLYEGKEGGNTRSFPTHYTLYTFSYSLSLGQLLPWIGPDRLGNRLSEIEVAAHSHTERDWLQTPSASPSLHSRGMIRAAQPATCWLPVATRGTRTGPSFPVSFLNSGPSSPFCPPARSTQSAGFIMSGVWSKIHLTCCHLLPMLQPFFFFPSLDQLF